MRHAVSTARAGLEGIPADFFDRLFQILSKKISDLFAEGEVVEDGSPNVRFVGMIDYEITLLRLIRKHSKDTA